MSCNVYQPHLLILPEDEATKDISNGFQQSLSINERRIQILPYARGTSDVLRQFRLTHISNLRRFSQRCILLFVDFDDRGVSTPSEFSAIARRLEYIRGQIPDELYPRTFVMGVRDEPETLRTEVRMGLEAIGRELAQDCPKETSSLWDHPLLRHNEPERDRLLKSCSDFLFRSF